MLVNLWNCGYSKRSGHCVVWRDKSSAAHLVLFRPDNHPTRLFDHGSEALSSRVFSGYRRFVFRPREPARMSVSYSARNLLIPAKYQAWCTAPDAEDRQRYRPAPGAPPGARMAGRSFSCVARMCWTRSEPQSRVWSAAATAIWRPRRSKSISAR